MQGEVKRGEYLLKVGDCTGCHTPRGDRGEFLKGLEYGGGTTFGGGEGAVVAAANLTPDPTGISYYDESLFVAAIRTGHVRARPLSPAMPWWVYRNMTDADLKALFAYLRTLKPVEHVVDNAEPPTQCELCGQRHGHGDKN
jgi:mono/diheme cytochrome c family protein